MTSTRPSTSSRRRPGLLPQNTEYLEAREMTGAEASGVELPGNAGNADLFTGAARNDAPFLPEFRLALKPLIPQNEFGAARRVRDGRRGTPPMKGCGAGTGGVSTGIISRFRPLERLGDFHYRGDAARVLIYDGSATSYGLSVTFDDSFPTRPGQLRYQPGYFRPRRLSAASAVHKGLSVCRSRTQSCSPLADTARKNHRMFDRMGMRPPRFYVPSSPDVSP